MRFGTTGQTGNTSTTAVGEKKRREGSTNVHAQSITCGPVFQIHQVGAAPAHDVVELRQHASHLVDVAALRVAGDFPQRVRLLKQAGRPPLVAFRAVAVDRPLERLVRLRQRRRPRRCGAAAMSVRAARTGSYRRFSARAHLHCAIAILGVVAVALVIVAVVPKRRSGMSWCLGWKECRRHRRPKRWVPA